MPNTLGYHIVLSGYGLWLPGDARGHWSETWDEQIGLIEPRTLHVGDPERKRMAAERMQHDPVRLSPTMITVIADVIGQCCVASDWDIAAASIEPTHTHLLITYTPRDIDSTIKWIKDRTTKAVHKQTAHIGPLWCRGKWRSYIFDDDAWQNTQRYIERHNIRRKQPTQPYSIHRMRDRGMTT